MNISATIVGSILEIPHNGSNTNNLLLHSNSARRTSPLADNDYFSTGSLMSSASCTSSSSLPPCGRSRGRHHQQQRRRRPASMSYGMPSTLCQDVTRRMPSTTSSSRRFSNNLAALSSPSCTRHRENVVVARSRRPRSDGNVNSAGCVQPHSHPQQQQQSLSSLQQDPVALIVLVELEEDGEDACFLTKVRIRASEGISTTVMSSGESSSSKEGNHCQPSTTTAFVYTARQLWQKVQQHFAAASSSHVMSSETKSSSSTQSVWRMDVWDAQSNDYVELHDTDCSNVVEHFGSRLRLRASVTEQSPSNSPSKRQHQTKPAPPLAIQGRYYNFDGSICVNGQRLSIDARPNQHATSTGWDVWDGSLLLARYLDYAPSLVQGHVVLELGAGCGVAGLAAAAAGASHVTMTDMPDVVPLLQSNVDSNKFGSVVECRTCDWFDPPADLLAPKARSDVILVADCVWVEHLVQPLMDVLHKLTTVVDDDDASMDKDSLSLSQPFTQHEISPSQLTPIEDDSSEESITHFDLMADEMEVPKETSPVCSWVDINTSTTAHRKYSGMHKALEEEASFGSLHEPLPEDYFSTGHLMYGGTEHRARRNQRTASCNMDSMFDDDDDDDAAADDATLPTAHREPAMEWNDSSPSPRESPPARPSPHVLISYQRRGKATHEAFLKGLNELFSQVEVLNPPGFDKPDVFYLLSCHR